MPEQEAAAQKRLFGVLGFPLGQSLSPFLHAWAFAQHDIAASYTTWETRPENLSSFMRTFRETPFGGASVTIPHKETIVSLLDGVTETAKTVGAVNTLYWDKGRLLGHNTDMDGFLAPLGGGALPAMCLVLGAGGAARAVLAGLASLRAPRVIIAARGQAKAEHLAASFAPAFADITVMPWDRRAGVLEDAASAWVINTTPMGMRGKAEGESALPDSAFGLVRAPEHCLAYDLVYNPLETPFLAMAGAAGWTCRDGLAMFTAQAAAQFILWTGKTMDTQRAGTLLQERLGA